MTSSFNVELVHFDDRYIEDIAVTLAHEMKPLHITRATLEDLPYLVVCETDARTAFRLQQLLIRFPGVRVDILDSSDMSKVVIDMETVTLHYRIAYLENGKSIERENDLVSPLIARRELGLKGIPVAPPSEPVPEPVSVSMGGKMAPINMAQLVLDFCGEEHHKHAWPAAGNFIRSILTDY